MEHPSSDVRNLDTEVWPPPEYEALRSEHCTEQDEQAFLKALRSRHPKALRAIFEDARVFALYRGEKLRTDSPRRMLAAALRLSWQTDAFFSLACYRVRMSLRRRQIPVLPTILHKLSMAAAQVTIGDAVVIEAGIYVPHGQIVVDGITQIGSGAVITPGVSIGTDIGHALGPDIGRRAYFGTGARLLGPIRVGSGAQVAANSVVVNDVPADTAVAGAPARVVGRARSTLKGQKR